VTMPEILHQRMECRPICAVRCSRQKAFSMGLSLDYLNFRGSEPSGRNADWRGV
jgi:hypothetical protein